jgi:hypothetical protein
MRPAVAFYISGHGFGHAIRQIAIIDALRELAPDLTIVVRTSAPEWLFTRTSCGASIILPGETDTGLVQVDSLRPDVGESVRRARAFLDAFEEHVERERQILLAHATGLVVSDAPPLGCAAAAAAAVPSVVCSNFTWDWIYREYAEQPGVDALADQIGRIYALAAGGWRLPIHGGFDTMSRIRDLPFVARHGRADIDRMELRHRLKLPGDRRLALVSFGGYGLDRLPLDRLDCLRDWDVVLTTRGTPAADLTPGLRTVPEDDLYRAGLKYEDLVRAVDVVITKPGYGIVADCVANGAAMVYTSRGRFAEYRVMVAEMPRYLRCRHLELAAFEAGAWNQALSEVVGLPPPSDRPRTDGAVVAAALIMDALSAP